MPTIYYRLTNNYLGPQWSLDVVPNDPWGALSMSRTGGHSGQYWTLSPPPDGNIQSGKFSLHTLYKGENFNLDVINDGTNDQVCLADKGYYTGQYWHLHPAEADTWRLTNDFTGPERFLDVYPDKLKPRLAPGNTMGMFWTITVAKIV
ncbi:carbohydrate-binding module family 13 protein [Peziza echinospora]|nr:carbohydrate-binding module family 13 protein [Peziza echinospora]